MIADRAAGALLEPYGAIAERIGCSMAQLGLAWLLAQSECELIPIPGTRSLSHLKENAGAASFELDAAVVQELDQLINESTVTGARYTEERMAGSEAEQDRKIAKKFK